MGTQGYKIVNSISLLVYILYIKKIYICGLTRSIQQFNNVFIHKWKFAIICIRHSKKKYFQTFQTLFSKFTIQTIDPKKGPHFMHHQGGDEISTTHQQRSTHQTPGALEGVSLTKLMMSWQSTPWTFSIIFLHIKSKTQRDCQSMKKSCLKTSEKSQDLRTLLTHLF